MIGDDARPRLVGGRWSSIKTRFLVGMSRPNNATYHKMIMFGLHERLSKVQASITRAVYVSR
jgi:hypothetical protein